ALHHQEADKIPVDCGGMRSTSLLGVTYNRLKKYAGISGGETKIYDMVQQLCIPEPWYLDRFQIDVIDLSRAFTEDPKEWTAWTLPDSSPALIPSWLTIEKRGTTWVCLDEEKEVIAEMPEGSFFFDQTIWPLLGIHQDTFDDLPVLFKKVMWSAMADPLWKNAGRPDFYGLLRENAKKLSQSTDRAIMASFGGNLFEWGTFLYRNDEFMMNLLTERREMEKMLDALTELHLAKLDPFLEAVGPYVQVVEMGDDLGMQTGPMISPELYRDVFFPRHQKIYRRVKEKTGLPVFLHSCGAIYEFLPDLIEAGVDIINPVQTTARGMDPVRLKKEFGKDLVFWGGGIDTQHILPESSPEKIRDEVKRNVEIFMKDGGFVFCQIHNMLNTVPPENIIAMYEAVNTGWY
ncbi:MAG: uroporphyrinogen decarboxylase family protein, partial [Atribacterota bacterium]